MIRPKLLVASIVIVALGIAMVLANSAGRAKKVADELVEASSVEPQNPGTCAGHAWLNAAPLEADPCEPSQTLFAVTNQICYGVLM